MAYSGQHPDESPEKEGLDDVLEGLLLHLGEMDELVSASAEGEGLSPRKGRKRSFSDVCEAAGLATALNAALEASPLGTPLPLAVAPTSAEPAGGHVESAAPLALAPEAPATVVKRNSKATGDGEICGSTGGGGGDGGGRPMSRMERKATREKRRREEVNEKFEELLMVLEVAEAAVGKPGVTYAEGGATTPAALSAAAISAASRNRVEVLSRTIAVLRRVLLKRPCCAHSGPGGPPGKEEKPQEELVAKVKAEAVEAAGATCATALAAAAPAVTEVVPAPRSVSAGPAPAPAPTAVVAPVAAAAPAAPAGGYGDAGARYAAAAAAAAQAMEAAAKAAGFSMQAGPLQGVDGEGKQPIFIMPVFVPGCSPGTTAASQHAASPGNAASAAAAAAASPAPGPPTAVEKVAQAAVSGEPAVAAGTVPAAATPPAAAAAPAMLKPQELMAAAHGFQMATLAPLPQAVAQALAAGDEDTPGTHAVCA